MSIRLKLLGSPVREDGGFLLLETPWRIPNANKNQKQKYMNWIDLPTIKEHLRITEDYEDAILTTYGDSAEETVLNYLGYSYEELLEKHSTVPTPIKQATLMLVDVSYQHRSLVSTSNMYMVPYTFDILIKPYMKL